MNNNEFDLERMLARSQFGLSVLFVLGYFAVIGLGISKVIDAGFAKDVAKDLGTPVGIIVYYWFQRQRPNSANDGNNSSAPSGGDAAAPLAPPQNSQEKLK